MTFFHAVVRTDHQSAEIVQFDTDEVSARTIEAHTHHAPHHHGGVRTEHAFFGRVCDALEGIPEVFLTGTHTAVDDFRHYVDMHRPQLRGHIVGYEVVDHPTQNQLVALARMFFAHHNLMQGRPSTA